MRGDMGAKATCPLLCNGSDMGRGEVGSCAHAAAWRGGTGQRWSRGSATEAQFQTSRGQKRVEADSSECLSGSRGTAAV